MGYIYCITNNINDKKYVGKTSTDIKSRFSQHKRDSKRDRCRKRPLYDAMNKYGCENFSIEILESCPTELLNERECFWIEKLGTYHFGYNATKGGDGKFYIDRNMAISLYKEIGIVKVVAEKMSCCTDTISDILRSECIEIKQHRDESNINEPKKVIMYDKDNNFKLSFDRVSYAAKWLVENGYAKKNSSGVRGHISDCANGKTKLAYKHIWRYE